jgi:porin
MGCAALAFCRALMSSAAAEAGSPPEPALDEAAAVDLSVVYTADIWRNARGGLRKGWRYLDNLDVTLTVDAERALGWDGATLFLYGLYNNGESLTGDLVGDFQVASNIDAGVQAVRLYEAWIEQRLADERLSLKAGLYDLNSEFDTTGSGGLFINSSHGVGSDFSQSGENGPSIFPATSLAFRAEYRLAENWLVRAAALDGVPGDPERPRRTAVKFGEGDGALLIAELNYFDERTKLGVGAWRYTAGFEDILATEAAGASIDGRGNDGLYMLAERKITTEAADGDQGLSGWVRLGFADARFNPVQRYLGGGLVYSGALPGRDEDQLGLAFGWVKFGEPYRRASGLAGEPLSEGELNIELTYRAPVAPWLTLQPDVQYVVDPGGVRGRRDAVVLGLRTEIGF